MKTKRFLFGVAVLLMVFILTGCAGEGAADDGKLNVVCTNFPAYDFVTNIIGEDNDNIKVCYLLEKGVDMHNYQASADAIAQIMKADLCVYVGGESEEWVEDVLAGSSTKDVTRVRFMDVVELKHEVIKEGMEHDHEGEHEEHEHAEECTYDEHVWLSVKNAVKMAEAVYVAIAKLDADNAGLYRNNADNYIAKLNLLDAEYQALVDSAENKVIVVADRFPFLYLADDYGIEYYAAFPGCSAESEAGFETIAFLAEKVKEHKIPVVFQIETSNGSLVKTVIGASGIDDVKPGVLDSMQSVSKDKIEDGYSYIFTMQNNFVALKEALK
ncbi:MAG: zinc ABC transporter substrate-binding protein [Lachnospiraceae bacterium]|nr:zinc ABC transporter substrate-binding protein [Lachnospiraceae bacterium]